MRKLTVGIVNWNTKELLKQCLRSLKEQKTDFSFQVVVVDNASSDESVTIVKKPVTLIQNKENAGMAAGLNQVMKKYPADYFLFLHPDTEMISHNVLQKMVDYLDTHPFVGIAGPHLVYPNGMDFASAHRFPTLPALFNETLPLRLQQIGFHGIYLRTMDYTKDQGVDIIASACCFVRKKMIDGIGFLDERFGNWMAEWDLALHAKNCGWRCMYVPNATVVHYEGQICATSKEIEYKKYSYVIANKMLESLFLFYRKHYSASSLAALKGAVVVGMIAKTLVYLPATFFSHHARERVKKYMQTMRKVTWSKKRA